MDVVSPRGGAVPIDEDSLGMRGGPQGANRAFQSDPQTRALLEDSRRPDEVSPGDYQAIYFAGGHGAMWDFPKDPGLIALAEGIHRRGGIVSSVCHGAAGLLNLRDESGLHLVDGRRVTGYSNTEEKAVRHTGHVPFSLQDELAQRAASFSHGAGAVRAARRHRRAHRDRPEPDVCQGRRQGGRGDAELNAHTHSEL